MPVRVGVLGAGSWGLNHVRVLAAERGANLVVVADPDPMRHSRVEELAPGTRCTTSVDDLFATELDAIVIASPASTHASHAVRALALRRHVLIEKPMALSLAEARRIADAATPDVVAMVGHTMLFHPAVRRLRELLDSGALGDLYYVDATRANLGRLRRDENALWSFGPHDLSVMDYVIDDVPVEVTACGRAVLQPGVEDVVFLTVLYASGVMAHIHLSWLHPRKERRLTLVCSQKMVEFDDVAPDKLRIYDKGFDPTAEFTQFGDFLTIRDGDVHIPQLPREEPLRAEVRAFIDSIVAKTPPPAGLASGLRVTAMLDAAQRSLADGRPVRVQEMDHFARARRPR